MSWTKQQCLKIFESLLDEADKILTIRAKSLDLYYSGYKKQKKENKKEAEITKQQLIIACDLIQMLGYAKLKDDFR